VHEISWNKIQTASKTGAGMGSSVAGAAMGIHGEVRESLDTPQRSRVPLYPLHSTDAAEDKHAARRSGAHAPREDIEKSE